jgi:hypothetical protein
MADPLTQFYIIFDGPPSHESGRFVEVEDAEGNGLRVEKWEPIKPPLWRLGPFVAAEAVGGLQAELAAAQADNAHLRRCLDALNPATLHDADGGMT